MKGRVYSLYTSYRVLASVSAFSQEKTHTHTHTTLDLADHAHTHSWCGRAADRISAQVIYLRVVVTVLGDGVGVASTIATPSGTLAR